MFLAVGKIDVGCFNVDCMVAFLAESDIKAGVDTDGRRLPLEILCQAIVEKWGLEEYLLTNMAFKAASPDNIPLRESFVREKTLLCQIIEAQSQLQASNNNDILMAAAEWQMKTKLPIPTILAASVFMGISPVSCGFPVRAMLNPFLHWYRHEALSLSRAFRAATPDNSIVTQSREILNSPFCRLDSTYLMGREMDCTSFGFSGWGFGTFRSLYNQLPTAVQGKLVSPRISNNQRLNVKVPLIPEVAHLIDDYNPHKWAEELAAARVYHNGCLLRPQNLLWLQVVIIDIAIRLQIRGSLNSIDEMDFSNLDSKAVDLEGRWSGAERNILYGIIKSWKPTAFVNLNKLGVEQQQGLNGTPIPVPRPGEESHRTTAGGRANDSGATGPNKGSTLKPSIATTKQSTASGPSSAASTAGKPPLAFAPWDLEPALVEHAQIDFGGNDQDNRFEYKKLAIFLKLRALLLTAYLWVGPDSSDVFLAENYDTQMPLV